jgi:hypothetical protein
MSKLKDYDFYFIHIPKNAGTSFEKQFCGSHKGHHYITEFPKQIWSKTIAIVRNPYVRLISIYNYAKLDNSYWHSKNGTTRYPIHPMYDYCHTHTFGQFIKDICINRKFEDVIHLKHQYEWIITPNKKLVSKIVKMENINEDLSNILGKKINMIKINTSNTKFYDNYYTEELKKIVYSKYKLDFQLFNYSN